MNPIITTVNIGEMIKDSPIAKIVDAIPEINSTLEKTKEIMKAKAILADVQAMAISVLGGIGVISAAVQSAVDLIINTFDISFHELVLDPKEGGLYNYAERFNFHLKNKQDPNRPYDEGSAAMCSLMLVVNFKDLEESKKKFDGLVAMFKAAENSRREVLKKAIGAEDFDTLKEEFWGCWKKRYEAGTHNPEITKGNWNKQSLGVLFPEVFEDLQTTLEGVLNNAIPNPNLALLSGRIDTVFDTIIDVLKDIITIIDAWKSLLFDSGITVIIPPICAASTTDGDLLNLADAAKNIASNFADGIETTEATGAPPVSKTASENLYTAVYGIAGAIESGEYTELPGQEADYSVLLEPSQFIGGINIVFKGPSTQALMVQVETFCALVGINLPNDFSEKIYPF